MEVTTTTTVRTPEEIPTCRHWLDRLANGNRCRCPEGCEQCSLDGQTCTQCLGTATLTREGVCAAACPGNDVELGDRNNGRFCTQAFQCRHWLDRLADATRCRCPEGCKTCSYISDQVTCDACFSNVFMEDGACVDDCAEGTYGLASSLSGGMCVEELVCRHWLDTLPDGSRCRCGDDCRECRYRGSDDVSCQVCQSGAFLHDGECVAACPEGTEAVGAGNVGLECVSTAGN